MRSKYIKYKNKYLELKKQILPYQKGLDFTKLELSDSSVYSVSRPKFADMVTQIISSYITNSPEKTITECCANIGGDTISFSKKFKSVNAVELDKKTAENLKNNLDQYGITNVEIYNKNYLDIKDQLDQDIIFLDPPWGDYLDQPISDLYLSGQNILDISDQLLKNSKAKIIALKTPKNYNYEKLLDKFGDKYNIGKYNLFNKKKIINLFFP